MPVSVSTLVEQFTRIGINPNSLSPTLQQMVANEMDPGEYVTDLFAKEDSTQKSRFGAFGAMLGSKDPLKRCAPLSLKNILVMLTSKRLYTIRQKAFLISEKVEKMDFSDSPRPLNYYITGRDIYFIIENDRSFVIDWVRGFDPIRFQHAMDVLGIGYWQGGK